MVNMSYASLRRKILSLLFAWAKNYFGSNNFNQQQQRRLAELRSFLAMVIEYKAFQMPVQWKLAMKQIVASDKMLRDAGANALLDSLMVAAINC